MGCLGLQPCPTANLSLQSTFWALCWLSRHASAELCLLRPLRSNSNSYRLDPARGSSGLQRRVRGRQGTAALPSSLSTPSFVAASQWERYSMSPSTLLSTRRPRLGRLVSWRARAPPAASQTWLLPLLPVVANVLLVLPVAVSNFSIEDWGVLAGVTAVSFPLGYLAGERCTASAGGCPHRSRLHPTLAPPTFRRWD